ncbi:MAG: hypothetical protein WC655_29220, partial [Candidatus Hydrogenedentales bacterium]
MLVRVRSAATLLALSCALVFLVQGGSTQEDEQCFMCHGDTALTKTTEDGKTLSLFIDETVHKSSIHGPMGCIACHADIAELPHEPGLKPVDCGSCHGDEAAQYAKSLHGLSVANNDPLAPQCSDCHGTHDIRSLVDPDSRTNPIHI